MRDRKVTDRTARAEISSCAPRFADIDICASTSASRITRLRPGDLRFGNRTWDSITVEEFVDRLEDLVVTNNRSAIIPGGASQSVEPGLVKRLPAATGGTQIALKGFTTESVACSARQAEEHVHETDKEVPRECVPDRINGHRSKKREGVRLYEESWFGLRLSMREDRSGPCLVRGRSRYFRGRHVKNP